MLFLLTHCLSSKKGTSFPSGFNFTGKFNIHGEFSENTDELHFVDLQIFAAHF